MCMMSMFSDLVEETMEIFMVDFSVYGSSFEHCLKNLEKKYWRYIGDISTMIYLRYIGDISTIYWGYIRIYRRYIQMVRFEILT